MLPAKPRLSLTSCMPAGSLGSGCELWAGRIDDENDACEFSTAGIWVRTTIRMTVAVNRHARSQAATSHLTSFPSWY
jgi:hypothetical protein